MSLGYMALGMIMQKINDNNSLRDHKQVLSNSGELGVDSLTKCETNLVFKRLALLCYRGKLRNQSRRKKPAYAPNCLINYLSSTTSRFIGQ